MGRFKRNLRRKEMSPEYKNMVSSACIETSVRSDFLWSREGLPSVYFSRTSLMVQGIPAHRILFVPHGFSQLPRRLIRSVLLLSSLWKIRTVDNPWAAGDPGVAEWRLSPASPGQPASCSPVSLRGLGMGFLQGPISLSVTPISFLSHRWLKLLLFWIVIFTSLTLFVNIIMLRVWYLVHFSCWTRTLRGGRAA